MAVETPTVLTIKKTYLFVMLSPNVKNIEYNMELCGIIFQDITYLLNYLQCYNRNQRCFFNRI